MAVLYKCAACGFESDAFSGSACPQCGKNPAQGINPALWLVGLLPVAVVAGLIFVYIHAVHFPRPVIVFWGVSTFVFTILAILLRRAAPTVMKPFPRRPASPQPMIVQLLSVAIGICGFCFFACLLFGFVAFLNWYNAYQRFAGQPYHATTFEVIRPYYQSSAGMHGPDRQVYASGMVEGKKEWMNLLPYLRRMPNGQDELSELVPQGTVIPVYLFPNLRGQTRVQTIGALPPAETNHNAEMGVLRKGSIALAVLGALIFVLVRIRRSCAGGLPTSATAEG